MVKFCCVTPCYNAEKYIEQTVRSVLNQTALQNVSNRLHYTIKDGNSSDTTMDKIRAIVLECENHQNITIEVVSGEDKGMYDALASSFQGLPQGDVYSYLNAGDYYSPFAFEIVSEIFEKHAVHFLTGLSCVYNEKNHLLSCILPFKYDKELLQAGYYGTILPHVQQESTFWSNNLHQSINLDILKNAKLAGDYYLWRNFVQYEPLYIVAAYLGGFKIHQGQLSEDTQKEYREEIRKLADSGTLWMHFKALAYKVFWFFPNKIKKRLSKQIFEYDHIKKRYIIF